MRVHELPASPEVRQVVDRFCQEARRAAPGKVERVVLYGSVARGEAGPESDVDIWIDWQGEEAHGRRILGDLAGDIFLDTGVLLSVHVYSRERRRRLEEWRSAYYLNVQSEGLVVEA